MRSVTLDRPGGRVHLLVGGDPADPPLLLVHGLDTSAPVWLEVADDLAADHHVLAVDLPGFGRSPVGRRRATLRAHGDLIAELVRHVVEDGAVLVGSSVGAVAALLAAARHPWCARAVVLLAPAVPRRTAGRFDPTVLPLLVAGGVPGFLALEPWRRSLVPAEEWVPRLLDACYAPDSDRPSPATVEAMVASAAARPRRDHLRGWAGTARSLFWWLARPAGSHATADRVRGPVTLVEGVEDPVLPRALVRTTLARHPDWEHVPLAGVGHLPQLERPAAVLDTVRAVTGVG